MPLEPSEMEAPTPVVTVHELAKMPAVSRLTAALTSRGLRTGTAQAIAVAVCDPSAVRRQLEQPATMRVSGGSLEVIYADVWVPAVLPYPENPRMLPGLSYAVEGKPGRRAPLPPARPLGDGDSAELVLEPIESANLVGHLDAQMRFLRDNNDLADSVGSYGIQEPLLLVPLAFEHLSNTVGATNKILPPSNDSEWPTILTSVDGNSRIAAAYQHLRLDPGEVVTKLIGHPRAIRQRVGNALALHETKGGLSAEVERTLRVLVAPAAIVIGFRPDVSGRNLADAVQSRLGALHVAPPKPWSSASKFDLLLNVSLGALQHRFDSFAVARGFDGNQYLEWLAGNLSSDEATTVGLAPDVDFRAAALRWWYTDWDSDISAAIRSLDITGNVTPGMRANIAAEGALRSFRSEMSATEADNARRVLAALYLVEDLEGEWEPDDEKGLGSVATVTRKAITELAQTGRPGREARLLMLLAFYWMARYRIVPLQTRGGMRDRRKITDVITMMCRTEHGIRVLAQIIKDGRSGRTPRAVSPDGKVETNRGEDVLISDEWIRRTWHAGHDAQVDLSPDQDLANRAQKLVEAIDTVSQALASLREPEAGDGLPLVESVGLELKLATKILTNLDEIRDEVLELRLISKRARRTSQDDSDSGFAEDE